MSTTKKPRTDSVWETLDWAADRIHEIKGQGYADPVRVAIRKLQSLAFNADAVLKAKHLYYHQLADDEDALDHALMTWADQVDGLARALKNVGGAP